jgi:hypothetical protein
VVLRHRNPKNPLQDRHFRASHAVTVTKRDEISRLVHADKDDDLGHGPVLVTTNE